MAGESRKPHSNGGAKPLRLTWSEHLSLYLPWNVRRRFERLRDDLAEVAQRCDALEPRFDALEGRAGETDRRLDGVEDAIRALQGYLETVHGERFVALERRLDGAEGKLREVGDMSVRTRDELVPAVVGRTNLLMDRLAAELDETTSLVERMLRHEPLPVPGAGPKEAGLSNALREVQPALVEAFRGTEEEIGRRLERYLPVLRDAAPVLDLGCGRGELLLMLRDAGVDAVGVEADPALAQGAKRRGLEVVEGDAVEVLRQQPQDHWGAITAIHMMEHLETSAILELLGEARRTLRSGGLFVAECPNPRTLRVGAAEYWIDPTHRRPLLSDTLEVFLTASGFRVDRVEYLHPFPDEQRFLSDRVGDEDPVGVSAEVADVVRRVDTLAARLDELMNGPRDFVVVASKPVPD